MLPEVVDFGLPDTGGGGGGADMFYSHGVSVLYLLPQGLDISRSSCLTYLD